MDLRVNERACVEQGGHYNNKAIGGMGNRVAAAGGGLTAARRAARCASTVRGARVQLAWRGEWCGSPNPDCRQCAIYACYAYQIAANTKQKRFLT